MVATRIYYSYIQSDLIFWHLHLITGKNTFGDEAGTDRRAWAWPLVGWDISPERQWAAASERSGAVRRRLWWRPGRLWQAHSGSIAWAGPGWGARELSPRGKRRAVASEIRTVWPPWPLVKQLQLFLMRRPLCLCIPVDNNNFSLAAFRYFSLSLVFSNLTIMYLRVL